MQETNPIDQLFPTILKKFQGESFGEVRYGWHKKTMGQAIRQNDQICWLQVSSFEDKAVAERQITKILAANQLVNINKPHILDHFIWEDYNQFWAGLLGSVNKIFHKYG